MTAWATALCASMALVTGCADVPDAEHGYDAGWRVGYVAALGTAVDVPRGLDGDCRESASQLDADVDRFALVTYVTHRGALQHRVVPIRTDSMLKRGDWVYVNVDHCLPSTATGPQHNTAVLAPLF
ncbi:MAG TPA: hypothetical protein VJO99_19010 [Burkholderiaceae bacterium]|nr:hypothetical protein [Burkholderiaceae bacterium]